MICIRCKAEIPEGSVFCNLCGKKQSAAVRKATRKVRGNGQGCAYQRPGRKTWTAQIIVDWKYPADPSKPRIPIKKTKGGFRTKKDALAYCQTLREEAHLVPKSVPRLSYYWSTYEKGKMATLSDSKQTAYRIAWNRMEQIHPAYVNTLTVNDLQMLLNETCKSYYTMKDCKSLLTNLFRLAASDGFANDRIPALLTLPELEENERTPFSQEEQKSLWELYENGDIAAAVPLLMIYTGMMPGEVMQLRTEHIDLTNRTITGVGMKTKVRKKTPVVLAETILPLVQDLIDHARPDGFLFTQSRDDWYKDYYAVLDRAGCRHLSPYSCRHTTATALAVTERIAPQTIQKVMRWSTSRMLDRYAHPDQSDVKAAVDAIGK